MRAVVIANSWAGDRLVTSTSCPAPLLPLAGRPIVEHVCEAVVGAGATSVDWVLGPAPGVRQFLGDGTRWGATFRHHVVPDPARGYEIASGLLSARERDQTLVLGHADRLVKLADVPVGLDHPPVVLYGTEAEAGQVRRWTGWAVVSGDAWPVPPARDEGQLELHLTGCGSGIRWIDARCPSLKTVVGYLEANRVALAQMNRTEGGSNGVRVSPSASVHPTARLIAPVQIGAGCEVAAGATVGPYTTVGANCVIDRGAAVAGSVVLPGTYVGEETRLESVVADRYRVFVPQADGSVAVATDLAVGSLGDHLPGRLAAAAARWGARAAGWAARLRGAVARAAVSTTTSTSEGLAGTDRPEATPGSTPASTATD